MASGETPQKQLLSLIRDFAAEKSQGERRVSDLKNQLLDLQSDSDSASADLERAKRYKETAEQELRGLQVKINIVDSTILSQQARVSLLQDEMSKIGCLQDDHKKQEMDERDEFIDRMYEINRKMRRYFESTVHAFQQRHCSDLSSDNGINFIGERKVLDIHDTIRDFNNKIAYTNAQTQLLEGEYCKEACDHDEVGQELVRIDRRRCLVEAIIEETQQLQELSRQISEWEKSYASLVEELQNRFTCPRCQFNNMGVWEGISETV